MKKSPFPLYQKQIDELKKRIEDLERRPQFIPYIPTPYQPPYQPTINPYPNYPIATCKV
jgi:hypothetical protein